MRRLSTFIALLVGFPNRSGNNLWATESTEQQVINAVRECGGKVVRDVTDPGRPVVKVDLSHGRVTAA